MKLLNIISEIYLPNLLYHFTDESGLIGILQINELRSGEHAGIVSFTRDKNAWHVGYIDNCFRVTFNKDKLKSKYRIIPNEFGENDRGTGHTESEEMIMKDQIPNIKKYITEITFNESCKDINLLTIQKLFPEVNIN